MDKGIIVFGFLLTLLSSFFLGRIYPHPIAGFLVVSGMSGIATILCGVLEKPESPSRGN